MDALTDKEIDMIVQRLEDLVAELEHDVSARTFYTFVLLAQAFTRTKHTLSTPVHIRRCFTLAQRMGGIRSILLPHLHPWRPLTDMLRLIHSEATRLTTLYGVARPVFRTRRRQRQQEFRVAFIQATGKAYQPYGPIKTAKERSTITALWDEGLRTSLARFQASGEPPMLDEVMACLPSWADRTHERWSTQGWREPSATEVMRIFTDYVMICEACLETISQIASAALAQMPVVDRAQVTQEVEQQYAAQGQALRDQISAFQIPTDAPRAQKTQLRREKTQLQQALQALLSTQEAEITRHVNHDATARHKITMLIKTAKGYEDTLRRKVGKASVEVLPRIIWIYDFERQADDDWRAAQQDARRVMRQVRQASATPVAVETT